MTAALQETTVTYEELADLEAEFEDEELETIRDQARRTLPLYEKRQKLISRLPNFWPLVIEQAPPDIDEYIQPSDSALLLTHLTNLIVSRFELDNGPDGDPRSFSIRLEFSENDVFEDTVLEKKFWHRRAKDGWTGLVSEPVNIRWKKGKDLTNGLLGLVCKIWEEEQKQGQGANDTESEDRKLLKKKIQTTGLGGLSFFAWFGYIGRRVSAEENKAAVAKEKERRKLRAAGKEVPPEYEDESMDEEDDEDDEDDLETFQDGDELAICIAEDLWPGALKYFTHAQENDALSDDDFESDDEGAPEDGSPPTKKVKK